MLKIIVLLNLLVTTTFNSYSMLFFYKIIPANPPIFHADFTFNKKELCSPIIDNNILYQAFRSGLIVAQDIENKKFLWEYHVVGKPTATAYYKNILVVTTLKGNIYALNTKNGDLIWSYNTHKEILSKPIIDGDNLYIQTTLDTLYAFNLLNGSLNWQYTSKNILEGLTVHLTPSSYVSNNILYTGFSNGDAVAIDAQTGKLLWTHKPVTEKQLQDITIQPVGNDSIVIFASYDNGLMCLNKKDGTMVWERNDLKRALGLYITGNAVYAIFINGEMYRLDTRTGDTIWKIDLGNESNLLTPVEYNNLILVGVGRNNYKGIVLLDQDNGRIIKYFSIVSGISAAPIIEDNKIYAISNGGYLYCFE